MKNFSKKQISKKIPGLTRRKQVEIENRKFDKENVLLSFTRNWRIFQKFHFQKYGSY